MRSAVAERAYGEARQAAADIADALHGQRSGDGWVARCPAHDDSTPSLSVGERAGQVLVHCHAGCEQRAVIAALRELGLWSAAMASDGVPRRAPGHIWPYTDAAGVVVRRTARWDLPGRCKAIRPQVPDGRGDWRNAEMRGPRPPYRLLDLLARPGAGVLIVEGELTAEAAAAIVPDHVVTTSAGGADAAERTSWSPLRGRRVVLWPDADAAGARYVTDVARLVRDVGATDVRVVALPSDLAHGWDLADALPDGWTAETVRELISAAPQSTADGADDDSPPLDLWADGVAGMPELPEGAAPAVIERWARDVARRIGSDPAIGVMTALAVCAAAIDDAHRIQLRAHDTGWTESARLWTAAIAPPGGGKSPTMTAMIEPLRAIDLDWSRADAPRLAAWERQQAAWERIARRHAERQAAGEDPGELTVEPPRPPRRRRVVEDITIEALSEVLRDQTTGVLAAVDELAGWITAHDCYRDGGAGRDRALWIEAYEGRPRRMERIRRGQVYVPAWSVSLVGGIQPGPLSRLVGRVTDDGLPQRLLLYYARDAVAGVDAQPDYTAEAAYCRLIADLVNLPAPSRPYVLDDDAHSVRDAVEAIARAVAALPTTAESLRAACAKYPATYARLVLVYHVVDAVAASSKPPPVIARETCERAARLLTDYILPHAARCHAELGGDDCSEHTRWVAGTILAHKLDRITARDIYRRRRELRGRSVRDDGRRGGDLRAIARVMAPLELAGWVRPEGETYGSPTRWRVRPAVHTRFAARAAAERERRHREHRRITGAAELLGLGDPDAEHER